MRASQILRAVAALLVSIFLSACSLVTSIEKSEIRRLEIQRDALKQLKTELRDPNFAVDKQDLTLFVSGSLLNAVLAGVDQTQVPVPGSTTAVLQVNSIRYNGEDASGLLRLDAQVSDTKFNLALKVRIVARIVLQGSEDKTKLIGRVVVENIAPEIQWNCARWRALTLARRVLTAKVQDWALNQVKVEIPLSHAVVIDVPATDKPVVVPVPAGTITGQLKVPAFEYEEVVAIRGIWLLRDGIHVLVKYGAS